MKEIGMKEIERGYEIYEHALVFCRPLVSAKQALQRHVEAHPETAISKSTRSESVW